MIVREKERGKGKRDRGEGEREGGRYLTFQRAKRGREIERNDESFRPKRLSQSF